MKGTEVLTPSRIDLAGGTVDIFPLHIFEGYGVTVNAAIDLYARAALRPRNDSKVIIRSIDLKRKVSAQSIEKLKLTGQLDFLVRFAKFFDSETGFELETECLSPPGSGLGTSSSLGVAVCAAFSKMIGRKYTKIGLVNLATNIEMHCLGAPTGKQDQAAAAFGGLNAIHFRFEGDKVERLRPHRSFLRDLRKRTVLCFTGKSHSSSHTNWKMVRNYVEGKGTARDNIRRINETAVHMREAVLSGDVDRVAEVLEEEWQNRRVIAKGVSTPFMEKLISAARANGAIATKATGAGGGGSIVMLTEEGRRREVEDVLRSKGGHVLDFSFDMKGIRVV
jgi:D-glycero-alpha-D-manno-heptose-7-phosphate kinase